MNNTHDLTHTVGVINNYTIPYIHQMLHYIKAHVGEYKWSARATDAQGWLICDGRSLSRAVYTDLFEVLGTSFGAADSNTFRIPDYRGRVMGCVGSGSNLTTRQLGDRVGTETHTLTTNEMPFHAHTASTASAGSHNHGGATQAAGSHSHSITDPGHTHSQTTINDDFNSSGTNPPGFASDSAGTRTWNNINSATTGITVNSVADHSHTITTDGSHSHTVTVNGFGGGQAHNIMQPTLFGGNVFIFSGYIHQ